MNEKIVIVDDDALILRNADNTLSDTYKVTCLKSGRMFLDYVKKNTVDMLLLDIRMPEMDGFATLKALRDWEKETGKKAIPCIFLTANEDSKSETIGLSLGAMDFIRKPFEAEVLKLRMHNLLELIKLQNDLHHEVEIKTAELESLSVHVVQTLAEAIDAKDNYTNGHSTRVAMYSKEIAKRYGYSPKRQEEIYMMALLHDIGKIGIPDSIINKPGRLTDEEYATIKEHPGKGAKILSAVTEMPGLVTGARWHHERYDGKGYPDGLKGDDIPEEARIIAVADAYDAMTSNRSYRETIPRQHVIDEISKGIGTQFDERFAKIMLQMIEEYKDYAMRQCLPEE